MKNLIPNLSLTFQNGFMNQNDYYINLLDNIGKQEININSIKDYMINRNDTSLIDDIGEQNMSSFNKTDKDLMEIFKSKLSLETKVDYQPKLTIKEKIINPFEDLNKETDCLFWYFYVLKNGIDKYQNIKNKFLEEKNYKIKIVEKIRENKSHLRLFKITLADIENNIVNQQKISLTTFFYLINLFNIDLFYRSKNILFIININKGNNETNEKSKLVTHNLLTKNLNDGYLLETKENIDLEDFWVPDNFVKPFKSISSYKLDQLKDIFNKLKLEIPNGNSFKKIDYYSAIQNYLIDL